MSDTNINLPATLFVPSINRMLKSASFRVYETLNDFLPRRQKNSWIRYEFYIAPTVKDAIESMGVPHPEVNRILVNNIPVDFQYHLQHEDRIEVFPLSGNYPIEAKFILDVHLGKLAKILRLLGFDCRYANDFADKEIVQFAVTDNRIVLTRDVLLLKHKIIENGYWIRSQHPLEQVREVIHYFSLGDKFKPFERCLECNGTIVDVPKKEVEAKVPVQISQDFDVFFTCTSCNRIYWKGSHYDKMKMLIERLRKEY